MHLLLVDDENSLLQLLGQHMVRQGHTVTTADSVAAAKALESVAFDAAVIDWSLPDGNGLDVALLVLERDERTRVIFTSGYPLDSSMVPEKFAGRVQFLQKPFLPRSLVELLKTL